MQRGGFQATGSMHIAKECMHSCKQKIILLHVKGPISQHCTYFHSVRFLGVSFPENSIAWLHWGNLHLHPVQLYESAILFVLFLISLNISFSNRYIFYLFTYGFVRFILEFIRGDERGYLLNISILSPSQIISLVLISISIIAFIYKSI